MAFRNRAPSQKPPRGSLLDRGHPLSRGLVSAFIFNEGGGSYYRDLSGGSATPSGASTVWTTGPHGLAVDIASTEDILFSKPTSIAASDPFSFTVLVKPDSLTRAYMFISEDFLTYFRFESNSNVRSRINGTVSDIVSSLPTIGIWQAITITRGVSTGEVKLYYNGQFDNSATQANWSGSLYVDQYDHSGSTISSDVAYAYFYDRELSAEEIASIYAAPYQMIAAHSNRIIVVGGGGGAPTTHAGGLVSTPRLKSKLRGLVA